MKYLTKSQREARKRHQDAAKEIRETQLTILCIDFGNFLMQKLTDSGLLENKIEITEQDVKEFAGN